MPDIDSLPRSVGNMPPRDRGGTNEHSSSSGSGSNHTPASGNPSNISQLQQPSPLTLPDSPRSSFTTSTSPLAAAATSNAAFQRQQQQQNDSQPHSPTSAAAMMMRGHGDASNRQRRRSSILGGANASRYFDPAVPGPGEMQTPSHQTQLPPAMMSASGGLRDPEFGSLGGGAMGTAAAQHMYRDRAPSLGQLHQELEQEQEAQVVSSPDLFGWQTDRS